MPTRAPPPRGPFPWGSRTFSSPFVQPAPLCPPAPKQTIDDSLCPDLSAIPHTPEGQCGLLPQEGLRLHPVHRHLYDNVWDCSCAVCFSVSSITPYTYRSLLFIHLLSQASVRLRICMQFIQLNSSKWINIHHVSIF